jgi:hypothetical protein
MIKNFKEFINESLDDSFTVVTEGDIKEALGNPLAERIFKFFNNGEAVFFSDEDEGLARKVGQEIWNLVSAKSPKYSTYVEYEPHSEDYRQSRGKTYQFYTDPIKGISKLVLVDIQPISFLVLKDDLEKLSGLIAAKRYNV